jgi:hypothetical protein
MISTTALSFQAVSFLLLSTPLSRLWSNFGHSPKEGDFEWQLT